MDAAADSTGVASAEAKSTSRGTSHLRDVSVDVRRFATWWSFEKRVDHVASCAALALGVAAVVVALLVL
jgi:hypothetical protein